MKIDFSKSKVQARYKTLYIKKNLLEKIEMIANVHDTSFNNVVVQLLEEQLKNFDLGGK